ncbi:hypothetical protein [Nocardia sp. NPDC059228]|uniref:hypothetical protein n=1 Tax=Nocardia sp. NPDC059228 TaxID=3346777 RepID=UPI0036B757CA
MSDLLQGRSARTGIAAEVRDLLLPGSGATGFAAPPTLDGVARDLNDRAGIRPIPTLSESLRAPHSADLPYCAFSTWRPLVNSPDPAPETSAARPSWPDALGRRVDFKIQVGADWWSVIVSGVVTVLAVFGVLPKIPW